ncbi:PAS domain-containing sensor histidine kinase [Jeongeupia sp. HS-3]|uniref:PAS domain-containing sensor histidine kinase n=1 Tax=Jeongeupia sp. HS-3 TaxID=1009682 RepID=UPI0018A594F4|nr:PAS domain S-box protein [Jeongeupia sp. HS-3]BCL74512.1 PAS domain-containing sensor histidine kinase [Jeongeupia sp. HS-3]
MQSFQQRYRGQWPWILAYLAIGLTLVVLLGYAAYDARQMQQSRDSTLAQDLLWQEQAIRLHLQTNQNVIENLAYSLAAGAIRPADFSARADALMKANPEIVAVEYISREGKRLGGLPVYSDRPNSLAPLNDPALIDALDGGASLGRPVYSTVIYRNIPQIVLVVPYFRSTVYEGAVLASYSLPQLMQLQVPWWMVQRYDLVLLDPTGQALVPADYTVSPGRLSREVSFEPLGNGLKLRASVRSEPEPARRQLALLVASVVLLLALLLWALTLVKKRMAERQRAEDALRDEIGFRAAMEDSLTTGLLAIGREGELIYVNPGFCQLVGWRADELVGLMPPLPFWPPERLSHCASAFQAIRTGNAPSGGMQLRFMRRNGERFDVSLYASRLVDGRGEHRGWMASLYDVTDIRREREALATSRMQLRTVLEGLDASVSVTDARTGALLYRNRGHARSFVLRTDAECCLVPLGAWPPSEVQVEECLEPASGRWFAIQRRALDWVDGRPVWLEIATDITERRQAAEDARQRDERLQHTARLVSMGEMASSLAHELNQPLAAIAGYAAAGDNLLQIEPPALNRARETLGKIGDQAARAGQIIRGIRNFVAKRAPREEDCRIETLLAVPMELLAPLARKAQVQIILDVPDGLPGFRGDGVMLEQVLFNLMKNGIEAMAALPAAPRRLTVSAAVVDAALEVSVSDEGAGFSRPNKLFQPFFSTKPDGMGMGLNICRSVMEQHRGHLRVENPPEGGCRFVCRLPLSDTKTEITEENA